MPHGELLVATDALEQAGDLTARLNCVVDLGTAFAAMEAADSAPLKAVRDSATELTRTCRELKEVRYLDRCQLWRGGQPVWTNKLGVASH